MREFLEDKVINKLNGMYLLNYAESHHIKAVIINVVSIVIVWALVIFRLVPPRIRIKRGKGV